MPRKDPSPPSETQFQPREDDSQNMWEVERILDERGPAGRGEYLIEWRGVDPATGESWAPTWEAKSGCTTDLIKEWKFRKAADPTLVGKAGKELEKRVKAKAEAERRGKVEARRKVEGSKKRVRDSERDGSGAGSGSERGVKRGRPAKRVEASPASSVGSSIQIIPGPSEVIVSSRTSRASSKALTPAVEADPSEAPISRRTRSSSRASTTSDILPGGSSATPATKGSTTSVRGTKPAKRSTLRKSATPVNAAKSTHSLTKNGSTKPPLSEARRLSPMGSLIISGAPPLSPIASIGSYPTNGDSQEPIPVAKRASDKPQSKPVVVEISSPSRAMSGQRDELAASPRPGKLSELREPAPNNRVSKRTINGILRAASDTVGPVPVPSPDTFRSYIPPAAQGDNVILTTQEDSVGMSQLDPIASFSSPARVVVSRGQREQEEEVGGDSTGVATIDPSRGHSAEAVGRSEAVVGGRSLDPPSIPRLEERIVNGVSMWVAVTESMDGAEADGANVDGGGANEQAGTMSVDLADQTHGRLTPGAEVEHIPAIDGMDTSAADEDIAVSVEVVAGVPGDGSDFARDESAETRSGNEAQLAVTDEKNLEDLDGNEKSVVDPDKCNDGKAGHGAKGPVSSVGETRDRSFNLHRCLWDECSGSFDHVADLRDHLSAHAGPSTGPATVADADVSDEVRAHASASAIGEREALLSAELEAARASVADLVATIERLNDRHESDNKSLAFIQRQYTIASDRAVAEVRKAQALEEKIEILQGQLKFGLQQRSLHTDAIKAQREAENARLRAQMHILLEQSRRTDDAVRSKAARYGKLHVRNQQLEAALYEKESKIDALVTRNEQLLAQVERLRAERLGVLDDTDEADSEDGLGAAGSSSVVGAMDPVELGYNTRPLGMTSSGAFVSAEEGVAVEAEAAVIETDLGPDQEVFWCKNVLAGGVKCKAGFDTLKDLKEHVWTDIDSMGLLD